MPKTRALDIEQLVDLCVSKRIAKLTVGNVQIEMDPSAFRPATGFQKVETPDAQRENEKRAKKHDDDVLFHSSS